MAGVRALSHRPPRLIPSIYPRVLRTSKPTQLNTLRLSHYCSTCTAAEKKKASAPPSMDPSRALVLLVATMAMAVAGVGGDFAADRAECSDKLVGLATCLTYVQEQATAAAPTPDCCAGLKSVLQTSRKCLCVLVKDKDDPNLGLKINVTKALGLPQVCKASANVSDCPKLLNLPPNSKDAQVFEQYAKQMGGAQGASGGAGSNAAVSAGAQKNGAASAAVGPVTTRWLGVGGARAAALSVFSALAVPFLLLLG